MPMHASTQPLVDLIRSQTDPGSPITRAALERVVRAWTDGSYDPTDMLRMGTLATAAQAVIAAEFACPPTLLVIGDVLPVDAAAEVVLAVAEVFASTARPGRPRAWEYATAAAQLRSAVEAAQ